ncbi:MAG: phytoene dehydrogenase-like protein [Planctomycetota bacterium]|jgi:phytoene dehydrogenase-like protein
MSEHEYDTIVIGAGMSGLAAGIRLAQFDARVVVLDRHYLWGGLNSFYKRQGRRFDVGLHALTNYVPKGTKGRPLTRILRQLRIPYESLELGQQNGSRVDFPGVSLRWTNEFEVLRAEVADKFPGDIDGFDRLAKDLEGYPDLTPEDGPPRMARAELKRYLQDQTLVEMLLLPLLYYGSPTPDDVEWSSFMILFKSLYEEGFARPEGGVRRVLDLLRNRYKELGGELRMRAGVSEILVNAKGETEGVRLDDGTELRAATVISSAGYVETMAMTPAAAEVSAADVGPLTFVEYLTVLDQRPADLGHDDTIVFFNTEDRLVYGPPAPGEPVDLRSGVICCPDNYASAEPLPEGLFRLTLLARHDEWTSFDEDEYQARKDAIWKEAHAIAAPFSFDARPHAVFVDGFTPRTIERFTGHLGGAVYGSPNKQHSGRTSIDGLFLCGTDQGYLGIVGAMLSGIAMANQHGLTRV